MNLVLSQPWVQKLGWTLIQFLWQGTVIAVGFAILRAMSRRVLSAQGRYILSCCTMAAMAILPVLTLFAQTDSTTASVTPWPLASPDAWRSILPWLVIGWLAGAIGFTIRFAAGWISSIRLRRVCVTPLPAEWTTCLEELMARLRVSRPVQFLQSALVDAPMMTGWLRPVVLIPAGMITGLPPEYVRALLAHELAHVRRFDYLINILQSGVEAVLFYHPAVWWISDQIRADREECCDDLAVAASGDVLVYASALAELETRRAASRGLALAANGGPLLRRIRRLVQPPASQHSIPGPAAAIMSVLWLIGMGAAVAHGSPAKPVAAVPAPVTAPQPVEAIQPSAPVAAPAQIALNRGVRVPPVLLSPFGPPAPPQQTPAGPTKQAATPAAPAAAQRLPEGTGKSVFENTCGGCHGADIVIGQTGTREVWQGLVDSMRSRGALGTDEEFRDIVNYLTTYFGVPKTARVEGTVVSSAGGPVRGADVRLVSVRTNGTPVGPAYMTVSDDNGKFAIEGIDPATGFVLSAQKTGYSAVRYGVKASLGPAAPAVTFELKAGESLKNMDLTMIAQGVLVGAVRDADGDPVANAQVISLRRVTPRGTQLTLSGTAQTNDLGEFRLAGLAPGRYYVMANSTQEFGKGLVGLPTFYANAANAPDASQVEVAGGEEKRIEIRIREGKRYTVRGKVSDSPSPKAGAMTMVQAVPDMGLGAIAALITSGTEGTARVGADGNFELKVTPGDYVLRLTSIGDGAMTTTTSQPIKVGEADLNGVVIGQAPSFTISGKVTVEEGSLAEVFTAAATLPAGGRGAGRGASNPNADANGMRLTLNSADGGAALNATVDPDGNFTIEHARPGHYNINQGTVPATYIKTLRWDGSDITEKELNIEGSGTLEIVFRKGAVRITGTVKNDKVEAPGGAMVVLWPEQPMPAFAYTGARMATSDNKNAFSMPALRPGIYYGIALEDTGSNLAQIRGLLVQFSAQATKVEIKENTPVTVTVNAIPGYKVREAMGKLP
jgi:beta-lactamase regulating signal transducer with metallopeptidase domain/cytochrome c5